jgi:hypothetical protein
MGLKLLSVEDTEAKYQLYGLLVFVLLAFWLEARLFVFSSLPLTFIEIIIYAGIIIFLFYLYFYAPLIKKNKSQGKVQALDYADSMIRRGKKRPDDLMLPFKEVYELDIDFEKNGTLTAKLKSKAYKKHHISYLESIIAPNVSEEATEKIKGEDLNALLDVLTPKLQDMRSEGILENLIKSEEMAKIKNKDQDAQDKERIEVLEDVVDQDFEDFKISDVKKEDIKNLKKLNIYWVILDSPQNYEGEKDTWDQLYIIIPHFSYKDALATGKGKGFYKGWSVFLKECFCFWEHLWDLTGNIQVLYLAFSENFDRPYLEPLKNLKAAAYAFLQLKVMEVYMNDLEVKPERLEKIGAHYREKARSLGAALSDVVQDEAVDNIVFSKYMANPIQKKLAAEIEKYKRKFLLALSGIVIAVLIMGVFVVAIL